MQCSLSLLPHRSGQVGYRQQLVCLSRNPVAWHTSHHGRPHTAPHPHLPRDSGAVSQRAGLFVEIFTHNNQLTSFFRLFLFRFFFWFTLNRNINASPRREQASGTGPIPPRARNTTTPPFGQPIPHRLQHKLVLPLYNIAAR